MRVEIRLGVKTFIRRYKYITGYLIRKITKMDLLLYIVVIIYLINI